MLALVLTAIHYIFNLKNAPATGAEAFVTFLFLLIEATV